METNKLLHFITVHDTQNMRQAAELLNMSHSALSKSIKTLEEEVNLKLFIPEGRGIVSTQEAEVFYERAKIILKEVSALTDLHQIEEPRTIKIATFEVFSTYFLSVLSEGLVGYQIELHEKAQGELEKSVSEGKTNLGITYEPIPFVGVEFLKINKIKMSPYTSKISFKNTDTLDIPFAAPLKPVSGAPSGVKGLDGWPDHNFPRKINYHVDMMESAIELTRQGYCAIFLPDFVANLHNKIVKPNLCFEKRDYPRGMKQVVRSVYIVKRKNSPESREIKKVARLLRSIK